MITFVTVADPTIYEAALVSWLNAAPGSEAVIVATADYGGAHHAIHHLGEVVGPTGGQVFFQLSPPPADALAVGVRRAHEVSSHEWQCIITPNTILSAGVVLALRALDHVERPFVVGRSWDIKRGADAETARLASPAAIDYVLYRRGTIPMDDLPPADTPDSARGNWLMQAAVERWGMTVIDATQAITAVRVVEDGRPGMLGAIDRVTGWWGAAMRAQLPPVYRTTDAPYGLRRGGLQARG